MTNFPPQVAIEEHSDAEDELVSASVASSISATSRSWRARSKRRIKTA